MRRVAIIGGTGAVGVGLIQSCIAHDTEIYVFVRATSERINNIPVHPLVHIVKGDMKNMEILDVSRLPKMDAFYFLAWEATFGAVERNQMDVQIHNIEYAVKAVHLAKRLGSTVFVGTGSQAEYGRVEGKLKGETPCFPENGYGMAKLCAGQMTRIECNKMGIRHEWGRILSVYGPCDGANTMVSYAISSCLRGEVPQFTLAEQMWDYIYSKDVGEALLLIGERGIDGRTYPIGNGTVRPLREYVEIICNAANPKIHPLFGSRPYAHDQVMYLQADITELQADTGFAPRYSFEDGIQETVDWFRKTI